jgi:protein O-mannosyl-transferase
VAAAAIASCVAGLPSQFVYDDVSLIEQNSRAHTLSELYRVFGQPYWPPPFVAQLYRPIASALLAFEYALGAGDPIVFRLISYALYAAVAVALLALARRVLPGPAALATALLFAVHPVHVEATALGVNQGELIVAAIAVVMTIIYIDGRSRGPLTLRAWTGLAFLYAIACLTKENGFVIPGLLLAAEITVVPQASSSADHWRSVWKGYFSLGIAAVGILVVRVLVLGRAVGAVPADALVGVGFMGRLLTMLQVVPTWLRLLIWPWHLQADYSPNEVVASSGFALREAAGLLILVSATAAAWFTRRRSPAIAFGLLWAAIALFPVSNLLVPTGVVVAERTLFLPSLGACVAGVAALWYLRQRFAQSVHVRRGLWAALSVLVALGVLRSARRQLVWRNSHRLALATALDAPKSLRVQQAHREAVQDMIADYERRAVASPEPWVARNELASLLEYMNEDSLAAVQLRISLSLNPRQPEVATELSRLTGERKLTP